MEFSSAMISCEREHPYHKLAVASYLADQGAPTLHVFVDGHRHDYLRDACDMKRTIIFSKPCSAPTRQGRCLVNMARALEAMPFRGLLFLEDDVELGVNWCERLKATAEEAEALTGPLFVLALFSVGAPAAPRHRRTAPYHPSNFFGTVALFFSKDALPIFAAAFVEEVNRKSWLAADMLVKRVIQERRDIHLLHTHPHLAEHRGDFSHIGQYERVLRAGGFKG